MAWKSILESLTPRGGPGPDPWEGVGEGINSCPWVEGLSGKWEDGSPRPPTPRGLVGFLDLCGAIVLARTRYPCIDILLDIVSWTRN